MAARKTASRSNQSRFAERWVAGAVASVVASTAAAALVVFDVAPNFRPLVWLSAWTGHSLIGAVLLHAVVGIAVLPTVFAAAMPRMRTRRAITRGLWFGAALGWLSLFGVLPLLGVGLFGLVLGWPIALAVCFVQALYGVTLALMMR
ncbi:hypothetical protein [uncultured Salinisphaera sp.]|uniref:hypothetical protein n=1 Tax=uncultured Salinisphaera sp. TaxID=359372 RepID=UPI0032B25A8F|tara:strand:- start:5145 stop:5585 length:441 start_codon:yes stop_codon:yes gene_type:complete